MFNKKKKNNKGFTLVELLVVIAIIGVLAIVAVPSLFKQINRAKATDVITYLAASRTAAISEYAATQEATVFDKSEIDNLVEDIPNEVSDIAIEITNSNSSTSKDTEITIELILAEGSKALKEEIEKQADANFGDTTVDIVDALTLVKP